MKTRIKHGKLIYKPRSYHEASTRLGQLTNECAKIQKQLDDPSRIRRYPSSAKFDTWRDGAVQAQRLFRLEERLTKEWIEENKPTFAEDLLLDAWRLLRAKETDGVRFNATEATFLRQLDSYFEDEPAQRVSARR